MPVETVSGEKHVNVKELQAAVTRVLTDPSFTDNARQVGERIRTYEGAGRWRLASGIFN